jgi:hypothetical protein
MPDATRTLTACCALFLCGMLGGAHATTSIAATPSAPSAFSVASLTARATSGAAVRQGSGTLTPTETWTLQFDYPAAKKADVTHFRIYNDPPGTTAVNALVLEVAASVLAAHSTDPALLTATVAMPPLKTNGVHLVMVVARNAPAGMTAVETAPTAPLTITVSTPTAPIPGMPLNPRIRGTATIARQHIPAFLAGRAVPIQLDVDSISER